MKLMKSKPGKKNSCAAADKVAARLAGRILMAQGCLAARLNAWFNTFPARRQQYIVITGGFVLAVVLITGALPARYRIPGVNQAHFLPHIGRASDVPYPHGRKQQLTDSLTNKK